MGELGVLVAVVASGMVGAWVSRLIAGTMIAPLLYLTSATVPPLTDHWWLVLLVGALVQAAISGVLLKMLLPSLSGLWIDFEPACAAMLVGNLIGGALLLWIGSERLNGHAGVVPALWVVAASSALLGLAVSSVIVMVGAQRRPRPRARAYPPGSFGELRRHR